MPPEIDFGQPQDLSHTTESPWEQTAWVKTAGLAESERGVY